MNFSRLITVSFIMMFALYSASILSAQSIPSLNVQQNALNGKVSLSGEWGLSWGEWTPLSNIASGNHHFDRVLLPNFIAFYLDDETLNAHRFGTYALTLHGLNDVFEKPAIRMRNINDAWQAWWIDEAGKAQLLGESGKIAKTYDTEVERFKTHILQLPQNVDSGTLVVYLSAQLYTRGGMYGEFEIQEFESANRAMLLDLASRAILIAIGLLVVFQNILFFIFRPKERILLLLGILAFSVLLRATVSTDYVYYFIGYPASFEILTKLEYITIIWPAVAAIHFFSCLYPTKRSIKIVKIGYLVVLASAIFTIFSPLKLVIDSLLYYQLFLAIFALYALWVVVRSILIQDYDSKTMIFSGVFLLAGVVNDVVASQSSFYNLFLAEYTLFLFLFAQTQFHSLRFVSALDTAEHLTDNLQEEVAEKTKELSLRNSELEEKAEYLKLQHDRIKVLSKTDHLTGLYNRQTFDGFLELKFSQAIRKTKNLSLVMLDIDNFKSINDNYGHPVGDECIKAMAEYLRQANVRKEDFVARYGGEEVVIILVNTDINTAKEISQRICEGLRKIKLSAGLDNIVLTASFGIAELIYNNVDSTTELLKLADDALYQAKALGKDQVVTADRAA